MRRIENILNWLNYHCIDIVIIWTFISSILPFILRPHSGLFFTFIGSISGALLAIYAYWDHKDKIHRNALTSIAGIIIILIGVASIIILAWINKSHFNTSFEYVCCIYAGVSYGGCVMTGMIEFHISQSKEKNDLGKNRNF